ncbi:MAG TPA: ComEA family DNA-binding protein [Phycisphaerales bacterium]|nr:ComEA family DNA-binding protein [Phycisphaerales bacterium]
MDTPPLPPPAPEDWTGGPAKWAAVVVLGAASLGGTAWSIWGRVPNPVFLPQGSSAETAAVPQTHEPAPPLSPAAEPPASPAGGRPGEIKVELNTATQAELELLPGIGPALAKRILDDRARRGAFKSLADLDRVSGIGPRTLERLRPLVTVTVPGTAAPTGR